MPGNGGGNIMQISFLFFLFVFVCLLFTYVHKSDNKMWNTVQCLGCVASRTGLVVHGGVPQGHLDGEIKPCPRGFHRGATRSCSRAEEQSPCVKRSLQSLAGRTILRGAVGSGARYGTASV